MTRNHKQGSGKPAPYFTPRMIAMELVFWALLTIGLYVLVFRNWLDAFIIGTFVYGLFVGRNVWKHRRENRNQPPNTPES